MFGVSLMLDCYDCRPGACDDMELHYRFLEELVYRIGMTPMATPTVIHGPREFQWLRSMDGDYKQKLGFAEKYPDKAGISAWQPLIESGIQIHSLEPKRFMAMDLFTCGALDKDEVIRYTREVFGFQHYEDFYLERGLKYKS